MTFFAKFGKILENRNALGGGGDGRWRNSNLGRPVLNVKFFIFLSGTVIAFTTISDLIDPTRSFP